MEDYTGLAAVAWQLFSGEEPGPDFDYFRRIIAQNPGPALDVGCGTGRLLLPFLSAGLDVDGVEPSADMLAICRRRVGERGLHPCLYSQTLQTLDLPRRYRTILVPCGTFQLVIAREEVWEALRCLHAHLEPGGTLVLTNYNTERLCETPLDEWRHRATATLPDGTSISKHGLVTAYNLMEQTMEGQVRYRRFRGDELIDEQICDAPERWYHKHELKLMLEKAGFDVRHVTGNYTDEAARDEHFVMIFIAAKA
jgi:SAM-dependent methyltransferase